MLRSRSQNIIRQSFKILRFFVVVLAIGVSAYFVLMHFTKGNPSAKLIPNKTIAAVAVSVPLPVNNWRLVAPNNAENTYTINVPESLLPDGACVTKEVLLALANNNSNTDYTCKGLKEALGYASLVFGMSTQSVVPLLGKPDTTTTLTLKDKKTVATKSIVNGETSDENGPYNVRYVIYEVKSSDTHIYYAVYASPIGSKNEDYFLKDFETVVTQTWSIPH